MVLRIDKCECHLLTVYISTEEIKLPSGIIHVRGTHFTNVPNAARKRTRPTNRLYTLRYISQFRFFTFLSHVMNEHDTKIAVLEQKV